MMGTGEDEKFDALFAPFALKSLHMRNRVVMAPMTRYFSPGGIPSEDVAEYYRKRAEGGVGLIITEGVGIERASATRHPDVPVFYGTAALRGWQRVVDEVHLEGTAIAPQLWHVGASPSRDPDLPETPRESPSGLFGPGIQRGEPMTDRQIADTIDAYASAAASAQKLGCEAVEVHGAHGYLVDQFFWGPTNRRGDRYGGTTLNERTRFAVELTKAIRAAVGPDLVLIFRLSQWKIPDYAAKNAESPAELEAWLTPLRDAGIDIFHCSQRRFWEAEFAGSALNLAGWTKKLMGCPTISVGSVGLAGQFLDASDGRVGVAPLDDLLDRLQREEFDLVAVGRALISEPFWANKIREGRSTDLVPYDPEDAQRLF